MGMVLLMAAGIEQELIIRRTKETLARQKAEGKKLGRPKGSHGKSMLDEHEAEIRRLLENGVAKTAIARMHGCSWQTVHNRVRLHSIVEKVCQAHQG
jgi:DNA invertase Pin-like site-specific DNA recombinase